jgi:integrase
VRRYLAALRGRGLASTTIESRSYVLRGIGHGLDVESPREVTTHRITRWMEERLAQHPGTAVAYLNQLRWFTRWLVDEGKLGVDPCERIETPKIRMRHRRRFLRPDEARRLLEACDDDPGLKFAVFCGLHLGLRKLEVIEARTEWLDLESGLFHVQSTETFQPKDRENRTIPLTDEFAAWLGDHYGRPEPYLLHPEVKRGRYRYRYDFRTKFENLTRRCELPDLTFHDLRRTFASLLVSRGVSLYKVAKWLGDTIPVVESTYGHLIPQDRDINAAWK